MAEAAAAARTPTGDLDPPCCASGRLLLGSFSSEELGLGANNYDSYEMDWLVPATCEPIQSVYFFSKGGSPCPPCSRSGWVIPAVPGLWGLTTALEW